MIQNLSQSEELNELNLAGNNITEIGNGLLLCTKLEYLNLSGNPISNLLGISDLKSLSSLRKLLFYDATYRITPIIQYVNYRSYVIKNLPQLTSLDDFTIHPEECLAVTNYYASKDLYYAIQYHSELYKFSEEIITKKKLQLNKLNTIQDRIFNGMMMLKVILCIVFGSLVEYK
ncbi:hypothetical protein O3M35_007636 [Rhynocoris fuscipes]|uniref:Dynein axonemal assembly factor 1 homolog n=1 Tax=Rhynocoris fuscipes TaxID=488301 RepID=A0AAW1DDQ9_9HEMI